MASLSEAKVACDKAWETMQVELHMRPSIVGVVRTDDGFGLRITLPRTPPNAPPRSLLGVPVEYRFSSSSPELLGARPKRRKVSVKRNEGV